MDKFVVEPKGTTFNVRAVDPDGKPGRVVGNFQSEAIAKAFADIQRKLATEASATEQKDSPVQ